jgi:hypothetical protein
MRKICLLYYVNILHICSVRQNDSIKLKDVLIGAETCIFEWISNNKVVIDGCLCMEDFTEMNSASFNTSQKFGISYLLVAY